MNSTLHRASQVFLVIGLAMCCAAFFLLWNELTFQSLASRANGTVTDIRYFKSESSTSRTRRAVVVYSVGGIDYETDYKLHFGVLYGPTRGDQVEVLYDPNEPLKAKVSDWVSSFLGPVILFVFGIVLLSIAWHLLNKRQRRKKEIENVKRSGHKKLCPVDGIQVANGVVLQVNGKSPSCFSVRLEVEGKTFFAFSEPFYDHPDELPKELLVYYDPLNPKINFVDLDAKSASKQFA